MPTYKVEKITPAKARILVKPDNNPKNRQYKPVHAAFLAEQMKTGQWKENGQTIVIDKNDKLVDGQHRLNAIIQADMTIPMLVCRGVESTVMNTIDTGRSRSAADTFCLNGISNYNAVSAITRCLMAWDLETLHAASKGSGWASSVIPSNDVIFKYHNKRKKDYQWAHALCAAGALAGAAGTQAGSALMILSRVHSRAKIEEFVDKIKHGGDYAKSPTHFLPQWIQKRKDSELLTHRYENLFAILYCFERWIDGNTVQGLKINKVFQDHDHYYAAYNKNRPQKDLEGRPELALVG